MPYREIAPHPVLAPFVDRFWVNESGPVAGGARILPDGCIDLIVDVTRGSAVAVGAMTRAALLGPASSVRRVAVRFRPGGAVPFLRTTADELTDRVVAVHELALRWLVPELVAECASLDDAAQALETQLLARLSGVDPPDPIVVHVARALFGEEPPSITALERDTGFSRQHLARAFRRHVGISPKRLARVARMQRATWLLQRERDLSVAAVAATLGYFDQAHLAAEFRDLVGITPSEARAAAGSISPIPSLLEQA